MTADNDKMVRAGGLEPPRAQGPTDFKSVAFGDNLLIFIILFFSF